MQLRTIDKEIYKQKQRRVALVLCVIFAVLGLSLSYVLRLYFGQAEGENMWVNLAGVLLGLVITLTVFSQFKSRPYFDELRYGWNLKRLALKIQNHRHRWEAQLEASDQTAATVLAFYHEATLQLQALERNEFGYSETVTRQNQFLERCEVLGLENNPDAFSIDMLEALD